MPPPPYLRRPAARLPAQPDCRQAPVAFTPRPLPKHSPAITHSTQSTLVLAATLTTERRDRLTPHHHLGNTIHLTPARTRKTIMPPPLATLSTCESPPLLHPLLRSQQLTRSTLVLAATRTAEHHGHLTSCHALCKTSRPTLTCTRKTATHSRLRKQCALQLYESNLPPWLPQD